MGDTPAAFADGLESVLAPRYFAEADDGFHTSHRDRLARHLTMGIVRMPGRSHVAAVRLDSADLGAAQIEVQAVADDAPLLVESVLTAVDRAGLTVLRVDHPVLRVRRTVDGRLTALADADDAAGVEESWITVSAAESPDIDLDTLVSSVREALALATSVRDDTEAMRDRMARIVGDLEAVSADAEEIALLEWIAARDNFVGVGYRAARSGGGDDDALGVWRDARTARPAPSGTAVSIDRTWLPTGVLRGRFPIIVRVPVAGVEHQFLGTITSMGLYQSVREIPVVRRIAARVLDELGYSEDSYGGSAAVELLQTFPLVELFATPADESAARIRRLLAAGSGQSPTFFVRTGADGHTVSVLVFISREAYSSDVRQRVIDVIRAAWEGAEYEFTTRLAQSPTAHLQIVMHVPDGTSPTAAVRDACRARLAEVVRTWDQRVRELLDAGPEALRLLGTVGEDYRDQRDPSGAAADLVIATRLRPGDLHVEVHTPESAAWTFTLYLCDRQAALTDVLPVLQSLGLTVLDEHPFTLPRPDGAVVGVYEFTASPAPGVSVDATDGLRDRVADAFVDMWQQDADVDRLAELVLRAGLTSRWVAMIRTYVRYLGQCGFGYTLGHIAGVLGDHRDATRALVELFEASFDPETADAGRRAAASDVLDGHIASILGLDADRVISALAAAVRATLRTTFYVKPDGVTRPTIAVKLRTGELPQAPQPRPAYEVFVHSPLVEGVHLRFGDVARGGLRWSDRLEDFRTEILGLVKAQAVKNAVIVPVGAKGGFVVRRPPAATGEVGADREATRAEGVACYRAFIASLLQVTDDLDTATGTIRHPDRVVRRDADDPYLVVAADKGTAAFSDIANDVSAHHDFWLGDAFASGGSVGYDHKAMGITARGAWESVKRHFWEMGVDVQSQDFTAVGIGDMSGDVFGNGMLLSTHTRLIAAFDHRHVFVDPDPDAERSHAERLRLFGLPRSSWADYDDSLISTGGGVWSRDVKSVPVSPQMRRALGLSDEVVELEPPALIRAVLLAPVDLLFNGGIGTYVKASDESDAQVGDKANDPIRVDGADLRVKVVGEGGNLGVTERGRIEADLSGVRINSDALDNSAGVDCSDHEVNIKILLDSQVASGALDPAERDGVLEAMTDDVARLVLADNVTQNAELGLARSTADDDVDLHARMLAALADAGVDLELEALPTPERLLRRRSGDVGRGLTSPELATLMAHVKLLTKDRLLASGLPDNVLFDRLAAEYFPEVLRERFVEGITGHRLRREIVTTALVNRIVGDGGVDHVFTVEESTGADTQEAARAYVVAAGVFGLDEAVGEVRRAATSAVGTGTRVPAAVGDAATRRLRRLAATSSRWLLAHRPQPLAIAAETTRYRDVAALSRQLAGWLRPRSSEAVAAARAAFESAGLRPELAQTVAESPFRVHLFDVHDLAEISDRDPDEVGDLLFAVLDHFGIDRLIAAADDLASPDRWTLLARVALHDDLVAVLRALTASIVAMSEPEESSEEKIAEWSSARVSMLQRATTTLDELSAAGSLDIATLSVGVRALRSIIG